MVKNVKEHYYWNWNATNNNTELEVQSNHVRKFIQILKTKYAEYKRIHEDQINGHKVIDTTSLGTHHAIKQHMYNNKTVQSSTDTEIYARKRIQRKRRGGMYMDSNEKPQTPFLSNLNKCKT